MKKDRLLEYIFVIILCSMLFFDLFVLNVFENKHILASFLLIYLIICRIFIKARKVENTNRNKVIILMSVFAITYIIFLYVVGIYTGFYINPINFCIKELYDRILPITAIIVLSELIRNTFITRNNNKTTVIISIALVLVDIITYINLYNILTLEGVMALIGYVVLSSISINLLCNYIVKRYSYIPNILYRIITTIYVYIVGVLPDIYLFFQSVFRIIYPYIIYLVIDYTFSMDNFKIALKNKKTNIIGLLITIIISISIVLLISCKFRYGIMVVGSSSMTGSINKGDTVIFEKYTNQELKEGEVIIFNKDDVVTIHRIKDVQTLNNQTIYYTKGDCNQQQDDGYRTNNEIIGVVKLKIAYIGWPTIWSNYIFTNINK